MSIRHTLAFSLAAVATLAATPAFAEGGDDSYEEAYDAPGLPPIPDAQTAQRGSIVGYSVEAREGWLAECRDRYDNDDGVGGAIIGGVVGGVAGNRIAGRGNRTIGTVAGAAVGAVAGAAIDKAEDRGAAHDFCEDYLDRYEASYANGAAYGHGGHGYSYQGAYAQSAYGYPSGRVMWVPVVINGGCKPKCGCGKREVVEEYVVERPAPARRVIRDKRIRIQPTKYVKTTPTKYSK
jgi:hypothetical protein